MKRVLIFALALVLCAGCLFSCQTKKKTGLETAKEYLYSMYRDVAENTAADFQRVAIIKIEGVEFAVEWTVTVTSGAADSVKVVPAADGKTVTIDLDEKSATEITYTLTATIKDADGNTETLTYNHKVPAYKVNSYEDYVRECGENDGDIVVIIAYVIAVNSAESSSKGSMWLQDADGHGYYAYKPVLTAEETASREALNAAYPIGTQLEVKGSVTTFSGCLEFNSGCTISKTGHTAEGDGVALTYTDATADFGKAADNKDTATLNKYQSARVSIKGATLVNVDNKYYNFTVNGVRFNLYKNNYFMEDAKVTELYEKFVPGTKADITGVVSVYSGEFQIYPDTVDSIKESSVELTPAEKVDVTLETIKNVLGSTITKDTTVNLPLKGTSDDVTVTWTVDNANVQYNATTGECKITVPDAEATVSFKATVTCGDATKELTIEVKLIKAKLTTAADIMNAAYALEKDTALEGELTLSGTITKIDNAYSEQYKNITVTIKINEAAEEKNTIQCFRLKGDGAENLKVGDMITVTGTMKNYNGTIEFLAGCTFVMADNSIVDAAGIMDAAYALEKGVTMEGDPKTLTGTIIKIDTPYSEQYKNITVTIAVVGANAGKTDIQCFRLKGDGAENLKVGDTVTVTGTIKNYNGTIEFDSGCTFVMVGGVATTPENPGENESQKPAATISFADTANRTSFSTEEQIWEQNGVKFTNTKASSTSDVADYKDPVRCYAKSNVKIEYNGMKKIVFKCSGGKNLELSQMDGVTVETDGSVVTVTFTEARDSFEISLTSQARFASIEIYTE